MTPVKFVKAHTPYAKDDIAGFEDKEAEELVKLGVAEHLDAKPKKKKE